MIKYVFFLFLITPCFLYGIGEKELRNLAVNPASPMSNTEKSDRDEASDIENQIIDTKHSLQAKKRKGDKCVITLCKLLLWTPTLVLYGLSISQTIMAILIDDPAIRISSAMSACAALGAGSSCGLLVARATCTDDD